jgi:hypothetical protein
VTLYIRLAALAAVLLAIVAGCWKLYHTGLTTGRAEIRTEWDAADNAALREREREISRLVTVTNNLNEAYREQLAAIDLADARAAADARRMRQLTAERAAALSSADPAAVREYAATAGDVFAQCRGEYQALGLAADRCSAAAHALDQWAAEVSNRPSRPTPPTPPAKP